MDIFHNFFYVPVFNLLIFLYDLFASNIGLAIIGLALFSRIITIPLTRKQKQNAGKAQFFQQKMKDIRKKYKHNQEKMAQELAKLQAEFLPGQLKGCLSLILSIILLIQVRNVVVDLIDKGVHAYNVVSYSEGLKKPEDAISFKPATDLGLGAHTLKLQIAADNGNKLEKTIEFEVVADKEKRVEEIKTEELGKSAEDKQKELQPLAELASAERASDIAVYSELLNRNLSHIVLSNFLIFTTDSVSRYLLTDKQPEFIFYVRPPSNQKIVSNETKIFLDDQDLTTTAQITQGGSFNLNFAGMNLSKVASDFSINELSTLPYILLAVFVGISQYFVSKIYAQMNPTTAAPVEEKKKPDHNGKDKKKHEEDEPDFAQMMSKSTKQMNLIFPVMTTLMSLGYLGGASLFPAGVSLFWTGQNAFVIIQQVLDNREKVVIKIKERVANLKSKFPTKLIHKEKNGNEKSSN